MRKDIHIILLTAAVFLHLTSAFRFERKIIAVGYPYYRIMMYLGTCKDSMIFNERKIWRIMELNRVLDIFYRSTTPGITVSRVEIDLTMNSTSTIAHSSSGVGDVEFSGTVYLPTNVGFVIYKLRIYTCDIELIENTTKVFDKKFLPFLSKVDYVVD